MTAKPSATVAAVLLLAGAGCDDARESPSSAATEIQPTVASIETIQPPRRAIEPERPPITLSLPRAQIASETRTVLGTRPRIGVHWQLPVKPSPAGDRIELSGEVTADVPVGTPLLVTARVSFAASTEEQALDPGVHRLVVRAEPVMLSLPPSRRVAARIMIPDSAGPIGEEGLADLIVRPMAGSPDERWTTRRFPVAPGDRLVFGYGIEEDGWVAGFPAVAFSLVAESTSPAPSGSVVLFERTLDPAANPEHRRWFDTSLDVSELAGTEVRFVFTARPSAAAHATGLARSFPVVSNPELVSGPKDRMPPSVGIQPSVILISLDTLRARSMSAYGRGRETTPNFDARVAGEGVLVRQAVTPFPYTPPSHMSMLTGLDVCAHGVEDRYGILDGDRVTLAEALRAAGLRTAAFTENGYVVAGAGFARGFDTYHELRSDERAAPGFASETFARAEQWLRRVDRRPFFLFVHTYQVHAPYTPPATYQNLFEDEPDERVPLAHRASLDDYEREVRHTDDLLGQLLDVLEERGLADRTLLVVTSDHGEQFGEHFFTGHGFDLHDEALLVPMAFRAPGLIAAGQVVEEQVGLMDLTPTILALLGLPPLRFVQGRSFASLLVDDTGARHTPYLERALVGKASHSRSLRTREYKYMEGTAGSAWSKLYRLGTDPDEQIEVAAGAPERVAAARRQLSEHDAECAAWRRAHPGQAGSDAGYQERPGWMINRDEIERKLRSLGYVE